MYIRRPRTGDPREIEKWQDEVSKQINFLNTKIIDVVVGPISIPGRDEEDGENLWPIPGPPGPPGESIRGLPGINIPGIDEEETENNYLSLRMGAHGSFADDDHSQYSFLVMQVFS